MSGGPRELLIPFVVVCLVKSVKIKKTVIYSDIDRVPREIVLPNVTSVLDEKTKNILLDINQNQPTTITGIAQRTELSESTISRFIHKLDEIGAVFITQKGKIKEIKLSLTGNMLLRS